MEFRLLESFVAVAEAGSVTAAARRLRISQPSLSQQMQRLEAELGVALLDRRAGNRGVALTPSGEALLVEARGLLAHRRRSVAVVRAVGDDAPIPVVLGLTLGVTPAYVSRIVDRIQADLPSLQVGLADPGVDLDPARRPQVAGARPHPRPATGRHRRRTRAALAHRADGRVAVR